MFLPNLAMLGVSMACAAAAMGQQWDPRIDFSVDHGNPNGVWSYGWMPVGFGTFTRYTNSGVYDGCPNWHGWGGDGTPAVWLNLSTAIKNWIYPGEFALHPGPGMEPSVVRWTAPAGMNGDVVVKGRWGSGDIGHTDVGVMLNGTMSWNASDHGEFDLRLHVETDSTIDFVVYGGYGYGNTALDALIAAACAGDYNADAVVDLFDYLDFVNDFAAGAAGADFNGDSVVDSFDYLDFVQVFAVGC